MRNEGSQSANRVPHRGPSWGTAATVALLLGVGAIVLGFDAALYAEYGGREGTEDSFSCDPQPDGSCAGLLERQAEREPRLMAKMNELAGVLGLVGLVALSAGIIMLVAWRVTKARGRDSVRTGRAPMEFDVDLGAPSG